MLLFDTRGCLSSYDLIDTDWLTFIDTFAWNKHRRLIVESMRLFLKELDALSINEFDMWLDGSFVTKKEQPNDLDIVFFLPTITYRRYERVLREARNNYPLLDIYFVRKTNQNERDYLLYIADQTEWLFQFTLTKPDRRTQRNHSKGFLQISWTNEQTI